MTDTPTPDPLTRAMRAFAKARRQAGQGDDLAVAAVVDAWADRLAARPAPDSGLREIARLARLRETLEEECADENERVNAEFRETGADISDIALNRLENERAEAILRLRAALADSTPTGDPHAD